jgi:50S ribosomal protein L16 3-hydroxylase
LHDALKQPQTFARGLGEYMTEPKPNVWFDTQERSENALPLLRACGCRLDRRTRMMFDDSYIFINGESFVASGQDADLMQTLANVRALSANDVCKLSTQAFELLASWAQAGWLSRS